MIKRIELQHKIRYMGEEYSVMLYNESDFTTAFKTLQYPSRIMSQTERAIIPTDPSDYSKIFIENGYKTIHYYSDENSSGSNEKRREFVDDIFKKYNANILFIFLVMNRDTTFDKVNNVVKDFCRDGEQCYMSVIIDSKIKKDSVRLVIGT